MPLHYSKYLKISHRSLVDKGVFDGMLDMDSYLHVDPLLLKSCNVPEFKGAYAESLAYFKRFMHLVPNVKQANTTDRFYMAILQQFTFHEISNTGLGFSTADSKGRGISGTLSKQLTNSAIEIIQAGYRDP